MQTIKGQGRRPTRRAILGALTGLASSVALAACGGTGAVAGAVSSTASSSAVPTSAAPTKAASSASVVSTTSATVVASTSVAVTTSVASTSSAAASSSVAATAAAPAAGIVTIDHLDWWQPNTPALTTFFNGNKADFEAKYPNVNVNYLSGASVDEVRQKWIVSAAGGVPPDTSQIDVSFVYDLIKARLAEPLDAYMAKSPDMSMSNFVASGLYENQQDGHTYGVPFDGPQILCIAYNVDHFKEAGIDSSKDFTWKWTTEQFLDTANKLNRIQGGKTVRGGMQPFGFSPRPYSGWLYANGGAFYNQDYTKTLINSAQGRNALQLCQDLWLKYPFQVANDTSATAGDHGLGGLEKGVYSMTYTGFYTAGYIRDASPKLNFLFAPLPQGPLASSVGSTAWTSAYGMSVGGKKKDAAWEWVSWVNSEPAQEKYFAQVQNRPSARKAVYQSAAWAAAVKAQPAIEGVETLVPVSKQYPWINSTQVQTDTAPIWTNVQKGQLSVSDALAQAEPLINKALAR